MTFTTSLNNKHSEVLEITNAGLSTLNAFFPYSVFPLYFQNVSKFSSVMLKN